MDIVQNNRKEVVEIDKTIEFFNGLKCYTSQAKDARDVAINTMRKYQQLQAEYEARLKTDIVAMLVELKEQLREMHEDFFETEHFDEAYGVSDSMDVIQQKINDLGK